MIPTLENTSRINKIQQENPRMNLETQTPAYNEI